MHCVASEGEVEGVHYVASKGEVEGECIAWQAKMRWRECIVWRAKVRWRERKKSKHNISSIVTVEPDALVTINCDYRA